MSKNERYQCRTCGVTLGGADVYGVDHHKLNGKECGPVDLRPEFRSSHSEHVSSGGERATVVWGPLQQSPGTQPYRVGSSTGANLPAQPEPSDKTWQGAALAVGERLADTRPKGYYSMSAAEWMTWCSARIIDMKRKPEPSGEKGK